MIQPDLICLWEFQEPEGHKRIAKGIREHQLQEINGPIERVNKGVFGPYAARIREGQWFNLPRIDCPLLNISGRDAQVSVIAWIKRERQTSDHCEAIAGMWNETRSKRQYCLFLNLHMYDSSDQVCGHVSSIGGPTPGYKYCMDASIGATQVLFDVWQCVGFTYDGHEVKSYLNGRLDVRPERNPYRYEGGLFDGGNHGADFTVGAVDRSGVMGNWFAGVLGGLAVYHHALTEQEMLLLAASTYKL